MYGSEEEMYNDFNRMHSNTEQGGLNLRGCIYEDLGFVFDLFLRMDVDPQHLAALSAQASSDRLRKFVWNKQYHKCQWGEKGWRRGENTHKLGVCEEIGHLMWEEHNPESGGFSMACYLCDYEAHGYMNG